MRPYTCIEIGTIQRKPWANMGFHTNTLLPLLPYTKYTMPGLPVPQTGEPSGDLHDFSWGLRVFQLRFWPMLSSTSAREKILPLFSSLARRKNSRLLP